MNQDKELIKQELSEILTKYYDGSFVRLVREYIRISGMRKEEREVLWKLWKKLYKQQEKTEAVNISNEIFIIFLNIDYLYENTLDTGRYKPFLGI